MFGLRNGPNVLILGLYACNLSLLGFNKKKLTKKKLLNIFKNHIGSRILQKSDTMMCICRVIQSNLVFGKKILTAKC